MTSVQTIAAAIKKPESPKECTDHKPTSPATFSSQAFRLVVGVFAVFGGYLAVGKWRQPFTTEADYRGTSLAKCVKEISEGYRHYSTLRFAIFTLFLGVNGALGALYYNKEFMETTCNVHYWIPYGGVILTIACVWMELVTDINQTEYFYMARAAEKQRDSIQGSMVLLLTPGQSALGMRSERVSRYNRGVRIPIWTLYGCVAGFWSQWIMVSWFPGIF